MNIFYFYAILAVFISSVAQIFLKLGSRRFSKGEKMGRMFFNVWTILGVSLFFIVTLLSVYALREVDLKEYVFILPLSYLFVPMMSRIFLDERLDLHSIYGLFVIVFGILVFNMGKIL